MIWLKVVAAILFAFAVVVAWGAATVEHSAALIPGGLLAWVLSEFPAPSTYWPRKP